MFWEVVLEDLGDWAAMEDWGLEDLADWGLEDLADLELVVLGLQANLMCTESKLL